ncbi:nucleotidyltransferase domain-containing protein [Candidatus Parcubacteria bacterium]|nr:nucleotidyltransferase domain-containing protein [Candidatus Parcubacteria bacterium]
MLASRKNALKTFVRMLKERHKDEVEKIILFGSVARGDDRENSNVDVLVIVKDDSFKMQRLISEIVVDILLKTGVYISAKVLTLDEFNLLRRIGSSFYRSISKEGIVVG